MSAARARGRAVVALLDALPPLTLVVGKGGVGKTTCAVGLTSGFAERGERALLVSTDPAGSLATVLGVSLAPGERCTVAALPGCAVLQLDARVARTAFLARWRSTIIAIMDRGTYLDADDINGLVDAVLPGADEIFALLALAELAAARDDGRSAGPGAWERLVIDTAPTGHTLRLLSLPDTFDALIALLEAMQAKHRFMVSALTHRYRADAADDFLEAMRGLLDGLRSSLADATRTAALLVTRPEAVVVRETRRYAEALEELHIALAAVVVNAVPNEVDVDGRRALEDLEASTAASTYVLPRTAPPPIGVPAIGSLLRQMQRMTPREGGGKRIRGSSKGLRHEGRRAVASVLGGAPRTNLAASLRRMLTIVGGKGGVGKTTVSCALAIDAARQPETSASILLASTDPAPSIGDAFGIPDPGWARQAPASLPDLALLHVWQMDASSAFAELRDRYRDRIDDLFDAWVGRGIDAVHDRAILRDLLALAPPGIDELYALSALGEVLDERRYDCVIVDPAPTGHLLRLLEMPALALEWSHRLMRLLLKYRDIAGLGDAPQELVAFSRRTRALDQLLHDSARAGVVLVTLEEPIVEAESARLANALRESGIPLVGVLVNRASGRDLAPSRSGWAGPLISAPESDRPLVGLDAIADWCGRWRERD